MFTPPRRTAYLITRKQFRRALADILLDRRAMTAFSSDHIDNCMEEAELRLRFHRDEKSRARRRKAFPSCRARRRAMREIAREAARFPLHAMEG